jgi:hypothetical protein
LDVGCSMLEVECRLLGDASRENKNGAVDG